MSFLTVFSNTINHKIRDQLIVVSIDLKLLSMSLIFSSTTKNLAGIVRGRPVLIPGSGMQLTNISHVRDLSSMLSLAVADPITSSQKIFNCVSDRAVTFDGLAKLCARAAGLDTKIVHYDPKSSGVDAKKAFPFRNMVCYKNTFFTLSAGVNSETVVQHFYAEPRAAKVLLGWKSTTNLREDLKERFDEYVGIGRDKKQMKFDLDDKILESLKVPVTV